MDPITVNLVATVALMVLFAVFAVSSYMVLSATRLVGHFITLHVAKAAGWEFTDHK